MEAVQTFAKAGGLICHTKEEPAQAKARLLVPVAHKPAPEQKPLVPADRITTCANPQQQTALWRSLTPMEKIEAIKGC